MAAGNAGALLLVFPFYLLSTIFFFFEVGMGGDYFSSL